MISGLEVNDDLLPPVAESQEDDQQVEKTPQPFDVLISKSLPKDEFDDASLLSLIPKKYLPKAKQLLQILSNHNNEITWNSSGTLFIDGISIPNSNIYVIFPALFKKSFSNVQGLKEIYEKLSEIGLNNFFVVNFKTNTKETLKAPETLNEPSILPPLNLTDNIQWWYIGN